ncbi:S8 family peptidase [Effusibacillus dendaii]|uniref:Peptidase S8 n=1 Tax=Effusibacillus dendaii TaxID=2743772 RepID=A0A7I8D4P2_9BACL|nr:S8 family peptidase [Effusibacillus dendaii]BCJ85088.1 hypothetical protein skT53_00730 [Effusibacillus dendaii]
MKRYVWGSLTAALLVAMTAILGPRPFHLSLQNPPRIAELHRGNGPHLLNSANRTDMRAHVTGTQTRADIAAQDMAVTTALCIRDCRTVLQHLANLLDHTTDAALRQKLITDALQEHRQFRSIVLRLPDGKNVSTGVSGQSQRLQESVQGVQKTGQFYATDLYEDKTKQNKLFVSMAVPMMHQYRSTGILAAEVEMGFLRDVADHVDGRMGTQTHLNTKDGEQVLFHPEQPPAIGGAKVASKDVDGTRWNTASHMIQSASQDGQPKRIHNEVVVQFHQEPDAAALQKILSDIDGKLVKRNHIPSFVFRSHSQSADQMIAYFKKMNVKMVEPNKKMRNNEVPNDPLYPRYQWNFPKIQIEHAWKYTTGNSHTIIAVVDTGVDADHPEFEGQLVAGHNMIDDSDNTADDNGHGTHVAGVIVARTNNVEGVAGMNWNSKVMPVKALDTDGSGTVYDIADGIRWAADHGAEVINLSLGEYENSSYLEQAIQYATSKDVLVVAAMGNDDTDKPSYPAAYPNVLAVTAVDQDGKRATFSNYGGHAGVSAPGVSIASTFPDSRYAAMSGTSMASPHVAGLAGLIRSINPNLHANEVRDIIQHTASDLGAPGQDPYFGSGLINVSKAIEESQRRAQRQNTTPDQNPQPDRHPWWWPFRSLFGLS